MANAFDQFDQVQSAAPTAGNAFDQFDAPAQAAASTPEPQSTWDKYKSFIGPQGTMETLAHLGSGIVATPVAGLAGLGAAATNAMGLTNTPAADVTNAVNSALTYEPKTDAGKAYTNVATKPFQWLAQGADWAGDKVNQSPVGIPAVGGFPGLPAGAGSAALVNTAIQALPSLLIKGPKGRVAAEVPKAAPVVEPRVVAAQAAHDAGFSLSPNQAGGAVGKLAEGLTGQAKLERHLSLKNAPRVNELAAEELGLPASKSIAKGDLNRAKVEANKPYNELARTGVRTVSDEFRAELAGISKGGGGESFAAARDPEIKRLADSYSQTKKFSAQDAINEVRQLRKDGFANKYGKYDPEKNAKGDAQLKIADAIDNELERHADSIGKPELAQRYKAARVQLAKIATVENALRGTDVSALALARAQKNGAKLSGNLKTIADSATEFEKSFQEVRKIRDQGDLSVVDYFLGVGGGLSGNPGIAAAALARPAARRLIASDAYQRRFIGKGKSTPRASGAAQVDARQAAPVAASSQQKRASK